VIPSKLELDRQLVHRVQGPDVGPVPIATAQEVLLVDRFEEPRDRSLQQLVFDGRYP
jgi:hypothetical protein